MLNARRRVQKKDTKLGYLHDSWRDSTRVRRHLAYKFILYFLTTIIKLLYSALGFLTLLPVISPLDLLCFGFETPDGDHARNGRSFFQNKERKREGERCHACAFYRKRTPSSILSFDHLKTSYIQLGPVILELIDLKYYASCAERNMKLGCEDRDMSSKFEGSKSVTCIPKRWQGFHICLSCMPLTKYSCLYNYLHDFVSPNPNQ